MQSNLHVDAAYYPDDFCSIGPITRAKQWRFLRGYIALSLIGMGIIFMMPSVTAQTFGLGLLLPGLGFVPAVFAQWDLVATMTLCISMMAFGGAMVVWFATGNVILPCIVWGGLAVLAMWTAPTDNVSSFMWIPIAVVVGFTCLRQIQSSRFLTKREALNKALSTYRHEPLDQTADELSDDDLACLRLLLDRALQPVDEFNGFDVLDQFQTAALRYQLNFTSYALSMVQATKMPAFAGYMADAQSNLNAKQTNPKVWGYWKLENAWGNFDTNGDPFIRDNIMYSGFFAAQLLYQQKAVSYPIDNAVMSVTCTSKSGETYSYTIHEIIEGLVAQYKQASYGLLPCEPNWVFPLCNAITATAIRAYDSIYETSHWECIAPNFRKDLEAEFIDPKGQFIPFRSSYTGFAPPAIGGAVMQSFPCLFFNAVFPDLAKRQWAAMQIERGGGSWRSAIWPVDVGNYGFTRAAGYTATAAAAREMNDGIAAQELSTALSKEMPAVTMNGVAHRPTASVWSHANEMLARVMGPDALRKLVTEPMRFQTPYLKSVPYPDVLVAKAEWQGNALICVLVPAQVGIAAKIVISGLPPEAHCTVSGAQNQTLIVDAAGDAALSLHLSERTKFSVRLIEGSQK